MITYLYIGVGGCLGAISRYWLGLRITGMTSSGFPWGTLIINLSGCFILGLFIILSQSRLKLNSQLRLAISTGFLGAYTTFSTFSVETLGLFNEGKLLKAVVYVFTSIFLGIVLVWLGTYTARLWK